MAVLDRPMTVITGTIQFACGHRQAVRGEPDEDVRYLPRTGQTWYCGTCDDLVKVTTCAYSGPTSLLFPTREERVEFDWLNRDPIGDLEVDLTD